MRGFWLKHEHFLLSDTARLQRVNEHEHFDTSRSKYKLGQNNFTTNKTKSASEEIAEQLI